MTLLCPLHFPHFRHYFGRYGSCPGVLPSSRVAIFNGQPKFVIREAPVWDYIARRWISFDGQYAEGPLPQRGDGA